MKIETSWISKRTGKKVLAYYEDLDDLSKLPQEKIKSICTFCVCNEKFVIVKNHGNWEPVAGHVEKGETVEEALIREVNEQSNMRVLKFFPLGYLYTYGEDIYQARYLCITEPYGPFISDPDSEVTEIKLVEPEEMLKLIDWKDTSLLMKEKSMKIIDKMNLDK